MPDKKRDPKHGDVPWPRIDASLVKKYGWYVAELYGRDVLVMPIYRGGRPVFYSGRVIGEQLTKFKYTYPAGYAKVHWLSSDNLSESDTVFVAEGAADAAYLSNVGASIGLLGMHYDGSLNHLLEGKKIIVAMDGDYAGVIGGIRVGSQLPGSPRIFTLPSKDPTDYTPQDIEALLRD
jgi:DNA primase